MWDLWWTKSQWNRFFSEYFGFPIGMSPQMLHVHSFTHSSMLYISTTDSIIKQNHKKKKKTKKEHFVTWLMLRKPITKIVPEPKLTNK